MPTVAVILRISAETTAASVAVRSVLASTFRDFQIDCIDDGMTVDTRFAIESIARDDARVRIIKPESIGQEPADIAPKYIALAAATDQMLPQRLEKQVALLEATPELAALGGGVILTNRAGEDVRARSPQVGAAGIAAAMIARNPVSDGTALVRAEALRRIGPPHLELGVAYEYDLWLRLSEKGFSIDNIDEPVMRTTAITRFPSVERLVDSVTATHIAQALAALRREKLPQPTLAAKSVDRVEALEIKPERIRDAEIVAALAWADALTDAGEFDTALSLLQHAAAKSDAAATPRAVLARIHRAFTRLYNRQNRTVRVFTYVAKAKFVEQTWVGADLVKRLAAKLPKAALLLWRRSKPSGFRPASDS